MFVVANRLLPPVIAMTPLASPEAFSDEPVIFTFPEPVEEMFAKEVKQTPVAPYPALSDVPYTVILPSAVVTGELIAMPCEKPLVPFPLTPVIFIKPVPPVFKVPPILTPYLVELLAPRPSIVIFPLVVFTFTPEPLMLTPSNEPD